MKIGIIDAELIGNKKHRFPNLCCEKISSYHKKCKDKVQLLTSYEQIPNFDKIYISKVFTKTQVPEWVLELPNVEYGGTGFYYDKAPDLPYEIEHSFPDYHLYDKWIKERLAEGKPKLEFRFYTDYSIGYLTRGCFRGCYYCVNRNCKRSEAASPLTEFMDESRPKLCFLDDNFFACPNWENLLQPVLDSGKRFQFRQGLDERLLTKDKVIKMSNWAYDEEISFAFDNIEDKELIVNKLMLIRSTVPQWTRKIRFYVFCGADKNDVYDEEFWKQDILNMFERIRIIMSFGCLPYIMRFEKVYESKYKCFYSNVAAWCNQSAFYKKYSFRLFVYCRRAMVKNGYETYGLDWRKYLEDGNKKGKPWQAADMVEQLCPEISYYYDLKYEDIANKQYVDLPKCM